MLNVIATNEEPVGISKVSGIPNNWQKSAYNTRGSAITAMKELIDVGLAKSRYLLISYNDEGIISAEDWLSLLKDCEVKKYEIKYDTFKGCRNLKDRSDKVMELMYLVSRRTEGGSAP
jgi:adenine-specific DNA-methyltransferase